MPPGSEKPPQQPEENDGIKNYYTNKIEDLTPSTKKHRIFAACKLNGMN